jgi:hypothetical protein
VRRLWCTLLAIRCSTRNNRGTKQYCVRRASERFSALASRGRAPRELPTFGRSGHTIQQAGSRAALRKSSRRPGKRASVHPSVASGSWLRGLGASRPRMGQSSSRRCAAWRTRLRRAVENRAARGYRSGCSSNRASQHHPNHVCRQASACERGPKPEAVGQQADRLRSCFDGSAIRLEASECLTPEA